MANFSFTLDPQTQNDLSRLAEALERRRGDAIRFAIRQELKRQTEGRPAGYKAQKARRQTKGVNDND